MLINNKLSKIALLFLVILSSFALSAQNQGGHKFTKLGFEVRADFDYNHTYQDTSNTYLDKYGFTGKYFNILVGGQFAKKFSYYFRQRVIANPGTSSLFDNTDFLYLQYDATPQWGFRLGKEALAIGGFEYDAAPIDVHYYTRFWGSIYCFHLGASVIFTDKSKSNKLILQVANSPHVHYGAGGQSWNSGLLSYSLMWCGDFSHFKTLYSVNMIERSRGKFVNYISLGNKLDFEHWSWYVDYMNRAAVYEKYFSDFTLVSRLDVKFNKLNFFVKGGYEQNLSEKFDVEAPKDIMLSPGMRYAFYGLGIEYRPIPEVRLHAFIANSRTYEENKEMPSNDINANIGVSWNLNILKYLDKKYSTQQ